MTVETNSVTSIAALVELTLSIRSKLGNDSLLWSRGQSSSHHELLPSLLRDNKTSEEVFDRERRLLTRFRQRSLPYWPAGYPQDEWEHLFAMQHFGIPTRLLDWSENLLISTYFALSSDKDPPPDEAPVVWVFDPVSWNRKMPFLSEFEDSTHVLTTTDEQLESYHPNTERKRHKSPVAIYGTHNSPRIVSQRGTFVLWGESTKAMEITASDHQDTTLLWKVRLEGDRQKLFDDVRTLGFSETSVYPDLSSLSAELKRTEGWR